MIIRRPRHADANQRYWRRRANRQVRKARAVRSLGRWSLILFANLTLAGVLIYTGARTVERLADSSLFALKRIDLVGLQRAPVDEVRQKLDPFLGRNLLQADLALIGRTVSSHAWVLEAKLQRRLPDGLRVAITERTPSAVALLSGVAHVVDETGFVIGPSGPGLADDLPVLTGLEHLDQATLATRLRDGVIMLRRLRQASPAFSDQLSELDLSQNDRITVTTLAGGAQLLLRPDRIELNVRDYLRHRDEIARLAGSMQYVDLRWRDRISVRPTEPRSFPEDG